MNVSDHADMQSVLLARQPVFNADQSVHAYELLYHSAPGEGKDISGAWLQSLFAHSRLGEISGGLPVYVQVPLSALAGEPGDFPVSPPLTLEVSISRDDEGVLSCLPGWKEKGISIALRDVPSAGGGDMRLPDWVDLVKVDVMETDALERVVADLKRCRVDIVAERVETHGQFMMCRRLGFDYFQGYFFRRPGLLVENPALDPGRTRLLHLLGRTLEAGSPDELEGEICRDPGLSYKLLCFVNSACHGLRRRVDGIGHALAVLGLNNIQLWVAMLLMCTLAGSKPPALIASAFARGRFLELIAGDRDERALAGNYFVLGMFSLLAAMLDMPLEVIMAPVSLPPLVRDGLFRSESTPAKRLALAVAAEDGHWDEALRAAGDLAVGEEWNAHYRQSLAWADRHLAMLTGDVS